MESLFHATVLRWSLINPESRMRAAPMPQPMPENTVHQVSLPCMSLVSAFSQNVLGSPGVRRRAATDTIDNHASLESFLHHHQPPWFI